MKSFEQIEAGFENSEFFLEYMPIIALKSGKCVGAEALIRWQHLGELITPLEFILTIKNSPLIGLVTYWMIEEIGREVGPLLHSSARISIGINTPPELIGRGGVAYAISKAGLKEVADKLTLEITERGFLDQVALDAINAKKLSCKIAIDDFGTGDANLLQLSKIKADIIKIDKTFIDQIDSDQWISRMISGLLAFARELGMKLVAEGIENESQAELLKELGVDMGQGMFFSKSIKADLFLEYFKLHGMQKEES